MTLFAGLSAFPVTPADEEGRVDTDHLGRLVVRLAGAGVASIGVLGSTGGYVYLTRAERARAVAAAVEDTSAPSSPNIQVATGSNREGADAVARRLSGADIPSSVEAQGEEGAQVFRGLAGPCETQGAFNAALAKLKELGYEDAFATQ